MVDPTWPTAVVRERLVESTRTDRPDGYDFTLVQGIEYENGVETLWRTAGKVFNREWGSEQILEMSVENMPPHMNLAHVPKRVERKFVRGRRRGKRFEATVEHTFTFADGSVQKDKDVGVFSRDVAELADMSEAEMIEGFTATFEDGESLERFQPGKRLNSKSSDEKE